MIVSDLPSLALLKFIESTRYSAKAEQLLSEGQAGVRWVYPICRPYHSLSSAIVR